MKVSLQVSSAHSPTVKGEILRILTDVAKGIANIPLGPIHQHQWERWVRCSDPNCHKWVKLNSE